MCTETFLRLPEEKKKRILDAAWAAFADAPFAEVSINGIIRQAGIPRGSFYQYFADKNDLFGYLMDDVLVRFKDSCRQLLREANGDLFALQLLTFDWLMEQADSDSDTWLSRFLRFLRINPGVDLERMMVAPFCQEQLWDQESWREVDTSLLRRSDPEYLCRLASMLLLIVGCTVVFSLMHPERRSECRRELEERLNIIRYGSVVCPEPLA